MATTLRRAPVQQLIKSCHILLLQETHLRPGEEVPLQRLLPPGYSLKSIPRPLKTDLSHGYGGVAAIVHDCVPADCRYDLSSTDIMVIELPCMYIVNAYLYPSNSRTDTEDWSSVDPCQKLEETMAGLQEQHLPVYVVGDMNARTGRATAGDTDPPRRSRDSGPRNPRGNWLLRVADETGMCILNGAFSADAASGGQFTSFQKRGYTVIDYALLSRGHTAMVKHFSIDPQCTYSDHSVLHVRLDVQLRRKDRQRQRSAKCSVEDVLQHAPFTEIDQKLQEVMSQRRSWDEAMRDLYGPLLIDDPCPIQAYTDGSCLAHDTPQAAAGAGVYWGPENTRNIAERLPGLMQTNNRAELFAIQRCLEEADPRRGLHIYTDSEYSIRSIGEWAAARAELDWTCTNGDLLREISLLIRSRYAALKLCWVQGHGDNPHNTAADALAREGARKPQRSDTYETRFPNSHTATAGNTEPLLQPKVTFSIPIRVATQSTADTVFTHEPDLHNEPWFKRRDGTWTQDPRHWFDRKRDSHRHRAHKARVQEANMHRLNSAESPKAFWDLIKEWCTGRRVTNEVEDARMADAFAHRLNGPDDAPPQFDQAWREAAARFAAEIPELTEDRTPDQVFSRMFTVPEVAEGKSELLDRLRSAAGIDSKTYADLISIPNSAIAELFTAALRDRVIPSTWLTTLLAAVPKAKGPYNDPENFRMIALECCLLKLMTLLLDKRLRTFVDANNCLPATQNGFRPTYRTENNPFILRTAIETAWANKKPTYVAFVDLRNAFPSVNHDILWMKLWNMGVSGPLFDWIRKLYRDMRYRLRHEGGLSDEMVAKLGILMGDPSSPLAFLLYLSDFDTPAHADDITLNGTAVSHLEHADDMVLMSTSPEGLQSKLDALATWASRNQMEINQKKTVIMVFPRPRAKGPDERAEFTIYGKPLNIVDEQCYVGIWFSSRSSNIWESHFNKSAQKARRAANVSFFVESHTGPMPPWEGRTLYTAQVAPHLSWGTEVTGPGTLAQQGRLESVQLAYLRRLLRVQKRSQRCILFTETGLWPIYYRRLELQLRYLRYVLEQPDNHLARIALRAQAAVAAMPRVCWLSELRRHLYSLGIDLPLNATVDDVTRATTELKSVMQDNLRADVDTSSKLDILKHRVDYGAKGRAPSPVMKFRAYLRIRDSAVRNAITRLLVSDHRLSVEMLRRTSADRPRAIPRAERLCRFCIAAVEDPLHALFECRASRELNTCREEFWKLCETACADLSAALLDNKSKKKAVPRLPTLTEIRDMEPREALFALLAAEETAQVLASFSMRVFTIFDDTERYVPDWQSGWDDGESDEN